MKRPLEVLLHHMPSIASSDVKWEANFARSIFKQAKRPTWNPSSKQLAVMERLVGEKFSETDELEVLEDF